MFSTAHTRNNSIYNPTDSLFSLFSLFVAFNLLKFFSFSSFQMAFWKPMFLFFFNVWKRSKAVFFLLYFHQIGGFFCSLCLFFFGLSYFMLKVWDLKRVSLSSYPENVFSFRCITSQAFLLIFLKCLFASAEFNLNGWLEHFLCVFYFTSIIQRLMH